MDILSRVCSVEGCGRPRLAKDYCSMHYERVRRHGNPGGADNLRQRQRPECLVEGCSRVPKSKSLCNAHLKRQRAYGDPAHGGKIQPKDGRKRHPLYQRWCDMIQRCFNPNCPEYQRYGARSITVCKAWREDFANYASDVGLPPMADMQVDRKDNDGNYSCGHCDDCRQNAWPANCRWVTRSINCVNRDNSSRYSKPYIGVATYRKTRFLAYARHQGVSIHFGSYRTPDEAAWMRDQLALGLWGNEANLNFEYLPTG